MLEKPVLKWDGLGQGVVGGGGGRYQFWLDEVVVASEFARRIVDMVEVVEEVDFEDCGGLLSR